MCSILKVQADNTVLPFNAIVVAIFFNGLKGLKLLATGQPTRDRFPALNVGAILNVPIVWYIERVDYDCGLQYRYR
jgi:hypothetical protein